MRTPKAKPNSTTGDTIMQWKHALPQHGLVVVNGFREQGKTRTIWGLAEEYHQRGRVVVAYKFPRKLRRALPKWVQHIESLGELKCIQGAVIVADEMAREAHAREHATSGNIEWAKMMAIIRQFGHLLFAIYQHSRQMELSLAMDSDLTIFKQPSQLHIRFARPELRPEVQEAYDRFTAVGGEPREYAFVMNWHTGAKGFLRCPTPSFWSEELSNAYALADIEQAEAEAKQEAA